MSAPHWYCRPEEIAVVIYNKKHTILNENILTMARLQITKSAICRCSIDDGAICQGGGQYKYYLVVDPCQFVCVFSTVSLDLISR